MRKDVAKTGKRIALIITKEDVNDIIRNIKPLQNSSLLIARVIQIAQHEIKHQ